MNLCPRVLIVDDDVAHLQMYTELLEDEGCQVDTTGSNLEAITMLGCQHYDVAVIELVNRKKTMAGWLTPDRRDPREIITTFCRNIGCAFVVVSSTPVKPVNGHAVIEKEDQPSLLSIILDVASHSLAT